MTLIAPRESDRLSSMEAGTVQIATVQKIVNQRCSSCHANSPTQAGFATPPKGVVFETAEDIIRQAQTIHQQTVVTKAMPIGNLTGITNEERTAIDAWFGQINKQIKINKSK